METREEWLINDSSKKIYEISRYVIDNQLLMSLILILERLGHHGHEELSRKMDTNFMLDNEMMFYHYYYYFYYGISLQKLLVDLNKVQTRLNFAKSAIAPDVLEQLDFCRGRLKNLSQGRY